MDVRFASQLDLISMVVARVIPMLQTFDNVKSLAASPLLKLSAYLRNAASSGIGGT